MGRLCDPYIPIWATGFFYHIIFICYLGIVLFFPLNFNDKLWLTIWFMVYPEVLSWAITFEFIESLFPLNFPIPSFVNVILIFTSCSLMIDLIYFYMNLVMEWGGGNSTSRNKQDRASRTKVWPISLHYYLDI